MGFGISQVSILFLGSSLILRYDTRYYTRRLNTRKSYRTILALFTLRSAILYYILPPPPDIFYINRINVSMVLAYLLSNRNM